MHMTLAPLLSPLPCAPSRRVDYDITMTMQWSGGTGLEHTTAKDNVQWRDVKKVIFHVV